MIDPADMKIAVSTAAVPYVLRNFQLDWDIFQLSIDEWCQKMHEHTRSEAVQFTSGTMKHCDTPYWERFRTHEQLTFQEFAKKSKEDNAFKDRWYSHSYRDIVVWPDTLKKSISFAKFGFENANDILFWLGSPGANTPCHYDTYGFNIVVQVFGRKSWLLFPPSTPLTPTRVPFEESSVYCTQNFYSPDRMEQFGDVGKNRDAFEVILNPGDVLIVPAHWWHYVENLDTSLTVNTWIPLDAKDCLARLGECFIRMQIDQITADDSDFIAGELRNYIYNPNEMNEPDLNLMNLFKPLADVVIENTKNGDPLDSHESQQCGRTVRDKFLNVFCKLEPVSHDRFRQILLQNSIRYNHSFDGRRLSGSKFKEVENIINAVCHPKTVTSACQLYVQQVRNQNS